MKGENSPRRLQIQRGDQTGILNRSALFFFNSSASVEAVVEVVVGAVILEAPNRAARFSFAAASLVVAPLEKD